MITILHGTDQESSYKRLSQLIDSYHDHQLSQFDQHSQKDEITMAIFGTNLIDDKRLIVFKNLLARDKQIITSLEKCPKELPIICWGSNQLSKALVTKLSKIAKVENFKLPPSLFYFLDNLTPGRKQTISDLYKINEDSSILWNVQNRFLLLILAKLKINLTLASKMTKRNLADWQWSKIKSQAEKFNLDLLIAVFNASLKIDFLIKSGRTNLEANTLLSVMLLKYL